MTTKLTGTKWLRTMDQRVIVLLYIVALSGTVQQCFSFTSDQLGKHENVTDQIGSTIILPLSGNVYPKGDYYATITVGNSNPPSSRTYFLDIDTGSDVTWIQCNAPCQNCFKAPHNPYKPSGDIVKCNDPICPLFPWPEESPCKSPQDQCDYEVGFADGLSSLGVVLRDSFSFKLTNGKIINPRLAFGCGYDQQGFPADKTSNVDGNLGLGNGKGTILAQLSQLSLVRNVLGHCFGAQGGYLFLGDNVLPSSQIVWAPLSSKSGGDHYSLGPAELRLDGQPIGVEGPPVIFDSGSTYTYFSSRDYGALLSVLKNNANKNQLKDATDDKTLPVCWKGPKAFKSIQDVKNLFKPLVFTFTQSKNVQFPLSPEGYLIISDRGNVCLGILIAEAGLEGSTIIGDISMQDQLVIYDNERQQIGWVPANCNKLP